jgi:hypothetical protein
MLINVPICMIEVAQHQVCISSVCQHLLTGAGPKLAHVLCGFTDAMEVLTPGILISTSPGLQGYSRSQIV